MTTVHVIRTAFVLFLAFEEPRTLCVAPAGVQRDAEQEQIEPVHQQGKGVGDELGQEPRRERHERHRAQEG